MLNWYQSLGARGRLAFWGAFGLVVNGIIYPLGIWMPILLFVSIGMLFIALLMKSEDSTDI
jgi:lipopolysaccharide export LptBFGC system permease protein LptF